MACWVRGTSLLAADADEVGVDGFVAIFGVADDESAAAGTAVDGAFEIVVVLALFLAGEIVRGGVDYDRPG